MTTAKNPRRETMFVTLITVGLGMLVGKAFLDRPITFFIFLVIITRWPFILTIVSLLGLTFLFLPPKVKRKAFAIVALLGIFVASYLGTTGLCFKRHQDSDLKKVNEVISAIETYQKTHNALPNDLRELVPAFLEEIPKRDGREMVNYRVGKNKESYVLCYPNLTLSCYSSELGRWENYGR